MKNTKISCEFLENYGTNVRESVIIGSKMNRVSRTGKSHTKEVIIMGKFVVRTTNTGVKFDLKATNGQVIATSEVYSSDAACKKGIASVQNNAPVAAVENQTVEGYAVEKHPKFEVYADKAGEFRFRLKATNGQVIATSEGYTTLANCLNGVESVKKNAVDAPIVEE